MLKAKKIEEFIRKEIKHLFGHIVELERITGRKIEPYCNPVSIKSEDLLNRIELLEKYLGIEMIIEPEKTFYKKKKV